MIAVPKEFQNNWMADKKLKAELEPNNGEVA